MPVSDKLAKQAIKVATKRAGKSLATKIAKPVLPAILNAEESSASKHLVGSAFKDKIIKKVVKGKGDWRYIVTDDDAVELVDKKFINALSRKVGTEAYTTKFNLAPKQSKLAQAYKSLELHKSKPFADKKLILDYHKSYQEQLKLHNIPVPKMSLVEVDGKFLTLPTPYADVLHKEGTVKKIKDL
jgi:hypothetical protein